jgi:ADP-heptose:LPS heptosyltransferase
VQRILVVRGGAIGDFILTLPALKLLRENFTDAHIEILGYKHITALADGRYYANATRSIEYGPLSRFFARDTKLPCDLLEYFASFDLIVSYLFDPDEIFGGNLKRCGGQRLITVSPKLNDREHAARQLAKPLQELGITLVDSAAVLFPNESDQLAAKEFLPANKSQIVAIHPGSGSERKNWPIENWIALGEHVRSSGNALAVIGGEADERQTAQLRARWKGEPVHFATNLLLPHLAAVLENVIFVGHDSGISHLAAAAGAKCILLFGPTDPAIWAPTNKNVKILRAPGEDLKALDFTTVRDSLTMWERP